MSRPASISRVITETSEKTLEVNVLGAISRYIEVNYERQVRIIAPTQNQELVLGYDEMVELFHGYTVFLQFKRPYPYPSNGKNNDSAKFVLDTRQMQTLLSNFRPNEAFYVLVPLPTTAEFLTNLSNLLTAGIVVDVYDIPRRNKVSQKTRTVRMSKPNATSKSIRIADPREFEDITTTSTLETLCTRMYNGEFGVGNMKEMFSAAADQRQYDIRWRLKLKSKGIYLLHLSGYDSPYRRKTEAHNL